MTPHKIALLTDSCADLTPQAAAEHHIRIVPLRIRCRDGEFRDGVDAAISVEHGTLIVTFPIEVALPQVSRFHEFGGDIGELDTAVSKLLVR